MLLFLSTILLPERDEHQHTAVESSGVTIHSFTTTHCSKIDSHPPLHSALYQQTVSSLFHHTNNDHVSLSLSQPPIFHTATCIKTYAYNVKGTYPNLGAFEGTNAEAVANRVAARTTFILIIIILIINSKELW